MYSRSWWITFLLLAPQLVNADPPKPTDRWKNLAKGNKPIIGDTPVNIPNLLPTLDENGIKSGKATLNLSDDGTTLIVRQISIDGKPDRLLAQWKDFNIGEGHSVRYIQPTADSVAVNIIRQESPSLILGSLDCSASCWLVNPNGVFFGEHAKVNTRGLIAAAMDVNPKILANFETANLFGSINDNEAFLVGAKDLVADPSNLPRISIEQDLGPDGKPVPRVVLKNGRYTYEDPVNGEVKDPIEQNLPRVLVKQGAEINSPGAPVLLAGPEVINEGDIRSDGGQIVMAGSRDKVYLALTAPDARDLRGFIVEVDSGARADGYRGAVVNAGNLTANLGNVTLVAGEVVQAGVIRSSTAVDVNGSVRLLARDRARVGDGTPADAHVQNALYLQQLEIPSKVAIGREAGDLLLTAKSGVTEKSGIYIDIDRTINSDKFLQKLNTAQRNQLFRLLGAADAGDFSTRINADTEWAEYAFDLAVASGFLTRSDRFEIVETAVDPSSRGSETIRSNGKVAAESDKRQPVSKVHLEGRNITFADLGADSSAVEIIAPSADVTLRATTIPFSVPNPASITDQGSDARVFLGRGTVIDVSGTKDTVVGSERNTLEFFLTSNEFRNAPEQKGGALLRQTVSVDIRKGTSLFDWTVGFANVPKSANERASAGGTIDILSSNTTHISDAVVLDAAGGKVTYEAGIVSSSRLLGANGAVNIDGGRSEDLYYGVLQSGPSIVNDAKWGAMRAYRPGIASLQTFRESYVEGLSAGSITLRSAQQTIGPGVEFKLGAILGPYQEEKSTPNSFSPDFGGLSLNTRINLDLTGADILLGTALSVPVANTALIDIGVLQRSNAGKITINSDGALILDKDADLLFEKGTDLDFSGFGVILQSDIRTVGGDITVNQIAPTSRQAGNLLVGTLVAGGSLDSSGAWTNRDPSRGDAATVPLRDAGNIRLNAETSLFIGENASFVANAGASASSAKNARFGKAGNITLGVAGNALVGDLEVEGALKISALDGGSGGTFGLRVADLEFGDFATEFGRNTRIGNDFFRDVLAGNFVFEALNGNVQVRGDADIEIAPARLFFRPELISQGSSRDVLDVGDVQMPPAYLASGSRLQLSARRLDPLSNTEGVVQIHEGSSIHTNPGSTIDLSAATAMEVSGSLTAKAGSINLLLEPTGRLPDDLTLPTSYIYVTETAVLDASSTAVALPVEAASLEQRFKVMDAGTVRVRANYGHALIAEGASIQLQGGEQISRQAVFGSGNNAGRVQDVLVPMKAGTFVLAAEQSFNLQAQVDFGAGGAYQGGDLQFLLDYELKERPPNSGSEDRDRASKRVLDVVLQQDAGSDLFSGFQFGDAMASSSLGKGIVTQKNLSGNNADSIAINTNNTLSNNNELPWRFNSVQVKDDVRISADSRILIDSVRLNLNDRDLDLVAPYVQLGESSSRYSAGGRFENGVSGVGELFVDAGLIDFYGNFAVSGANLIQLRAQNGVRVRSVVYLGDQSRVEEPLFAANRLETTANIRVAAPVLFAETLSDYTFSLKGAESSFEFGQYGAVNFPVISALGKFSIKDADEVFIDSRIEVPFGAIDIAADKTLELGANAKLSVSGAGLDVPLGRMQIDGLSWTYQTGLTLGRLEFNSAPGRNQMVDNKNIRLNAPQVTAGSGSTLDLSGGGRFYAREFVPGLGGDVDILTQLDYTQGFAVVPSHTTGFAPFDPLEFSPAGRNRTTIPWGTTLQLSGSRQLADGRYTVLPANYALLPGAYLVTPQKSSNLFAEGYRAYSSAGVEVVAGRVGTSASLDSQLWQSFRVESGTTLARRAEYRVTGADEFAKFAATAPGFRPRDNGRLNLDVSSILDFNGRVISSAQSPVGVSLDVSSGGRDIRVVPTIEAGTTYAGLQVTQDLFADVGAESILLGGTRSWTDGAWLAKPQSQKVEFAGADLAAVELMVVARDQIALSDTRIQATTATEFAGNAWQLDANGQSGTLGSALLVTNTTNSRLGVSEGSRAGSLLLDEDSQILAGGALALAFDGQTSLGNVGFSQPSTRQKVLQLFSGTLGVGDSSPIPIDLLGQADLITLDATDRIRLAGDFALDVEQLALVTPHLSLADNSNIRIAARQRFGVTGSAASVSATPASVGSSLLIETGELELSSNGENTSRLLLDATSLDMRAQKHAVVSGDLQVMAAGDLSITTPVLAGRNLAKLDLHAQGDLLLQRPAGTGAEPLGKFAPAPIFQFAASGDLLLDTLLYAPAGLVSLNAGADLTLGQNARIDLSPFIQRPPSGAPKQSVAGAAKLRSGGDMTIADMQAFVFGAAGSDTRGGELTLDVGGELTWTLPAQTQSATGVNFELFVAQLASAQAADLSRLNAGGFNHDFRVTVRNGDLDLGAANFSARNLSFNTAGVLTAGGQLSAVGGDQNLELRGDKGVSLQDGAKVRLESANAKAALLVAAPEGDLDLAAGSELDSSGDVRLVIAADRIAAEAATGTGARGKITPAGSLDIYLASGGELADGILSTDVLHEWLDPALALIDTLWDPENPISRWSALFGNQLPDRVMPFITLSAASNLIVGDGDETLDLAAFRTAQQLPGILEIRAGGAMDFRSGLSDGVDIISLPSFANFGDNDDISVLRTDDSWSFRIESGTNVKAMGDRGITLAAESFIRAGTGDIDIRSGGNLLQKGDAYIGSFGKTQQRSADPFLAEIFEATTPVPLWGDRSYMHYYAISPDFSGYAWDSGQVSVTAEGDIRSESQTPNAAAFMQRFLSDIDLINDIEGLETYSHKGIRAQFASLDRVTGGIHSVGGGDVRVKGHDIHNLSMSTPGQLFYADDKAVIDISGGDLQIKASGSAVQSSLFNNGGHISLLSRDKVGSDKGDFLIAGSDFSTEIRAARGVGLEAAANSYYLPEMTGRRLSILGDRRLVGGMFYGMGSSSVFAESIAGDVSWSPDQVGLTKFFPNQNFAEISEGDIRFLILPSNVVMHALSGDINLRANMPIFPDAKANIQLFAGENVYANWPEAKPLAVSILDIDVDDLPFIDQLGVNSATDPSLSFVNSLMAPIQPGVESGLKLHGKETDRTNTAKASVSALNGSIAADPFLIFRLPKSVDAFAGEAIQNTSFEIQHNQPGDVSVMQAGGDIRYSIDFTYSGGDSTLNPASSLLLRFAGPGDFVVMAGGTIDLGTTSGIRSLGNSENPLLPNQGGNLHIYAGMSGLGDYGALAGKDPVNPDSIPALITLFSDSQARQTASTADWFVAYTSALGDKLKRGGLANYTGDYAAVALLVGAVAQATGTSYFSEYKNTDQWKGLGDSEQRAIAGRALERALTDWQGMAGNNADMLRTRIAVAAMVDVALERPELFTNKGNVLFKTPEPGRAGFASQDERSQSFQQYWNSVGQLLTLEYLLTPFRADDLAATLAPSAPSLAALPGMSISDQLALARSTFEQMDQSRQMLVAEHVMTSHMRQSSREGASQGNTLVSFGRGYIAQQQFFGDDYGHAIANMYTKVEQIARGEISEIDSVNYGISDGATLASLDAVLNRWSADSGVQFKPAQADGTDGGNIKSILTTIQTSESGGNITLLTPRGSMDVGISQAQIASIGGLGIRGPGDLGVIAKGYGDVNAVVGDAFNVNESRTFTLAGGAVNLWSAFGDVDAGKGAKTVVDTPLPVARVNADSGRIVITRPPAVSGSGITTKESRSATGEALEPAERFYALAEGAGPIFLSTPLGIVDAGEAGIQSAGDLFIAASKVVGADNISVGGASVGVVADTTVGGDVAAAGSSANAATDAVQSSVADKAASNVEENVTAFVTVEILDTGTTRRRRDDPSSQRDDEKE